MLYDFGAEFFNSPVLQHSRKEEKLNACFFQTYQKKTHIKLHNM